MTVVPKGPTLKVRYVFASEEYPEYAGSASNDVMAVRVGGVDCARVPGTSLAVSVDPTTAQTNSEFYVDNTAGAAGYGTTMDGLTVPLDLHGPGDPGHAGDRPDRRGRQLRRRLRQRGRPRRRRYHE